MSEEKAPAGLGEVPIYQPTRAATVTAPPAQPATPPSSAGPTGPTGPDTLPPLAGTKGDERLVSGLFLLSGVAAVAFVVVYWVHVKPTDNWVNGCLGVTLAVALGAMGAGAILWAKRLMPHEVAVQEREPFGSPPDDVATAGSAWNDSVLNTSIARRPLLRRSLLLASGTLALPLVATLRSLNDKPHGELRHTHWTAGARMVDQFNDPIHIGDIDINGIATVFPQNFTDPDAAATSAVLLLRLPESVITPKIATDAFEGHIAFSKICTHAGCPASLYDQQTYTLICPCHQSQFKILEGAKPVAGPATRSLPQLSIGIDDAGYLIAKGDFSEPIGPGFWER